MEEKIRRNNRKAVRSQEQIHAQAWTQTRNASERRMARIRLLEMLLARCRCALEAQGISESYPTLLDDCRAALSNERLSSRNRRFNKDLTK